MNSVYVLFFLLITMTQNLSAFDFLTAGSVPNQFRYFLDCFAEEQQKNNALILVSESVDGDCGIETLGLTFDYYEPLDIATGRRLIVNLVNGLLQQINENGKFRPYFKTFPITLFNLDIRIRWRSKTCGFYYPPMGNIAYVTASDGRIFYSTVNSFSYQIDNLRTESFQHALSLLPRVPQASLVPVVPAIPAIPAIPVVHIFPSIVPTVSLPQSQPQPSVIPAPPPAANPPGPTGPVGLFRSYQT